MSAADVADRVIYGAGVLSLSMTAAVLAAAVGAWIRETRRARAARRRAQADEFEAGWAALRLASAQLQTSLAGLRTAFADMGAAADAIIADELARGPQPQNHTSGRHSSPSRRPLPPS